MSSLSSASCTQSNWVQSSDSRKAFLHPPCLLRLLLPIPEPYHAQVDILQEKQLQMTHDDIFAPLNSLCHLSFIVAHVVAFKLNEVLRDFLNQYTLRVLSCLQSHHYKTKYIFISMATKLVLPEHTRGWSQQAHA